MLYPAMCNRIVPHAAQYFRVDVFLKARRHLVAMLGKVLQVKDLEILFYCLDNKIEKQNDD
jgi:hypothetical protein